MATATPVTPPNPVQAPSTPSNPVPAAPPKPLECNVTLTGGTTEIVPISVPNAFRDAEPVFTVTPTDGSIIEVSQVTTNLDGVDWAPGFPALATFGVPSASGTSIQISFYVRQPSPFALTVFIVDPKGIRPAGSCHVQITISES